MEPIKNLELPLNVVKELSYILETLIEKEVETKTSYKHTFVDETGKEVKNPTPKQITDKKLEKIFDVKRTIFEPKLETTITEIGIGYSRLKYFLDSTMHKYDIQNPKEEPVTQ